MAQSGDLRDETVASHMVTIVAIADVIFRPLFFLLPDGMTG